MPGSTRQVKSSHDEVDTRVQRPSMQQTRSLSEMRPIGPGCSDSHVCQGSGSATSRGVPPVAAHSASERVVTAQPPSTSVAKHLTSILKPSSSALESGSTSEHVVLNVSFAPAPLMPEDVLHVDAATTDGRQRDQKRESRRRHLFHLCNDDHPSPATHYISCELRDELHSIGGLVSMVSHGLPSWSPTVSTKPRTDDR
jgi:hypothetical protein